LAKNTSISLDANKGFDQLTNLLGSGAIVGAIVLNAAADGKGHDLYYMADVMNVNHSVYHKNYCGFNAACHVYKTKLPGASNKVKLSIDRPWGTAAYKDNTMIVDECMIYVLDGTGTSLKGNVAS
jgi:hypothetical protein